jgi:adenosine kinase
MSFRGSYSEIIHPERLHSLSVSTFLDQMVDARGGVGANIVYSLGLLGAEPAFVSAVGKDAHGYMDDLHKLGVDISGVHFSKTQNTASFNVMTDSDQNQIGGFYPGAMFESDTLTLEPWKDAGAIITVSPQDPRSMDRAVLECKEWGLRLFYDPSQQVTNITGEHMVHGIEAAEVLILNEYEIGIMSRKSRISIQEMKDKVPIVITTYGKLGSVIEGKDVPEAIKIGIAKAERMADPTGAGDAYRAGFLYGYSRRWSLKACGQLAAVTASFALEHIGTQIHTFTVETVAERYKQAFNEELER